MASRKFDVGDPIRVSSDLPVSVRSKGIRPGMYGKVTKVAYDEVAQHTIYTVQVGSKKATVRAASLTWR